MQECVTCRCEGSFYKNSRGKKGRCIKCCNLIKKEKIKSKMDGTVQGDIIYLDKIMLSNARKRSKKKGLEFELTLKDLVKLKNVTCPILGCKLLYCPGIDQKRSASLDRIDSSKGYTKENVRIISSEGNWLKNRNDLQSITNTLKYLINNLPVKYLNTIEAGSQTKKLVDFIKNIG